MDWDRILNAAVSFFRSLGIGIVGIIAIGGKEAIPNDWPGWLLLVCLALNSSYDKYSTSTRVISPNRKVLTEDERRDLLGLVPKKTP